METQPAFVGADGAIHLHTVTAIDMNLTVIILPRHPELDDPFRLNKPFQQPHGPIFRVLFQKRPERAQTSSLA